MLPSELQERVRRGGLLGDGWLLAMISGGRDSVCLLDVAVAVRGSDNVHALHVNYGLRGQASEADASLCEALCERLGVELKIVAVPAREREPGNLQAWARELRYDRAQQLADELDRRLAGAGAGSGTAGAGEGADTILATGHTASDQLETILYRLAASPGRRALLGMAAREGRLVRPLLEITREQTAAYCRARGLRWREDASNEDERFARARVRRRLVPALLAIHPAAGENVLRTSARLREESQLLDELVARELGGRRAIAVERLREMHPALARLVVIRMAEDAAGSHVPQAGRRVGEILALARRGGPAQVHVGGNVGAVICDGELRMVGLPPRDGPGQRDGGDRGE